MFSIRSFAGARRCNSPSTVYDACRPIYGCSLDHQQIKADTVSSGPALAGSAPAQTDCWSMAVTRSHSAGTCCCRTHVELRMSNSDFNCNKWSRLVIIQIFGEGIITCHRCHCCFVSPFVPRLISPLKSRRCLCVDAHLILAINWQLCPHTSLSGSASRPSICCCEGVLLRVNVLAYRSASLRVLVHVGSGRLQKICDLWLCACWHLCSQRCSSLALWSHETDV